MQTFPRMASSSTSAPALASELLSAPSWPTARAFPMGSWLWGPAHSSAPTCRGGQAGLSQVRPAGWDAGSGDTLVYPVCHLALLENISCSYLATRVSLHLGSLLSRQTRTGSTPPPWHPEGIPPPLPSLPSKGPAGTCLDKNSLCFCVHSQRTPNPEAGIPQDGYREAGILPAVGKRKVAVPGAGRKEVRLTKGRGPNSSEHQTYCSKHSESCYPDPSNCCSALRASWPFFASPHTLVVEQLLISTARVRAQPTNRVKAQRVNMIRAQSVRRIGAQCVRGVAGKNASPPSQGARTSVPFKILLTCFD